MQWTGKNTEVLYTFTYKECGRTRGIPKSGISSITVLYLSSIKATYRQGTTLYTSESTGHYMLTNMSSCCTNTKKCHSKHEQQRRAHSIYNLLSHTDTLLYTHKSIQVVLDKTHIYGKYDVCSHGLKFEVGYLGQDTFSNCVCVN